MNIFGSSFVQKTLAPKQNTSGSSFKKFLTPVAVMVLISVTMLLTGCHGRRSLEKFSIPEAFDTSRNYEITFWAKNDTNKTQTDIYAKAIADFEALYPNIHVNIRLYTDYGRI